jgi:hypothetical protein
MILSDEYINQCSKSLEIQALWKPDIGDYSFRIYSPFDTTKELLKEQQEIILIHYKSDVPGYYHSCTEKGEERSFKIDDLSKYSKITSFWLPTLNQLWEMLSNKIKTVDIARNCKFKDGVGVFINASIPVKAGVVDHIQVSDLTMESALLKLIMKVHYNKIWAVDNWIKNTDLVAFFKTS